MVNSKPIKIEDDDKKCLLFKYGKCNSSYNKGEMCDGLNAPDNCPYKSGGSFAMSVRDVSNRRK